MLLRVVHTRILVGEHMDVSRRAAAVGEGLRPLRVHDLERELERVAAEVTDLDGQDGPPRHGGSGVPVRISTGEFVRRMSRFLCFN